MADPDLTGVLLVGGASARFGAPKALARLGGHTLAEIAWGRLAFCDERLAVGKAEDELALPFPVLDDGAAERAALAGLVAGLRAAAHDLCVVLPVDVPLIRPETLRRLAARAADAAVTQTGPLPGAYRRSCLPVLERRLRDGCFVLCDGLDELDVEVVEVDESELANVNTREDLELLARRRQATR